MALPKRVKNGGTLYKGDNLTVSSATGDYVMAIRPSTTGFAVNGISVTPSTRALIDSFSLQHVDTVATVGGNIRYTLIDGVFNQGAEVSINFDFPTIQLIPEGESLRFIYTNTATEAMTVGIITEVVR